MYPNIPLGLLLGIILTPLLPKEPIWSMFYRGSPEREEHPWLWVVIAEAFCTCHPTLSVALRKGRICILNRKSKHNAASVPFLNGRVWQCRTEQQHPGGIRDNTRQEEKCTDMPLLDALSVIAILRGQTVESLKLCIILHHRISLCRLQGYHILLILVHN